MKSIWMSGFGVAALVLFTGHPTQAQYSNHSSVINGFGGRSTGGAYIQVGAGAQPGGIGVSYEGGSANYTGGQINRAGFLHTFVLAPGHDANTNGIPDELDPDNDGDGLWDHWEVSGEKFSPTTPTDPNRADSDGNQVSDYDEMIAGTDPHNASSTFEIIDLAEAGPNREVTWTARGNNERIYVVRAIDDSYDATPSTVIWSNTVAGGVAPWYPVEQAIADPVGDHRFYAVEVIHP